MVSVIIIIIIIIIITIIIIINKRYVKDKFSNLLYE